ncbi:MAG: gamma-glutamyltransferase family protein [Polyangiales bacterium]
MVQYSLKAFAASLSVCVLLSGSACGGAPASSHALARAARATDAVVAREVAEGRRGAVSSAEPRASEVGRAVLEAGGNAVDAAVAVAFALGVTHPSAGNIGGGGFMVVRLPDGRSTALDYREVAPGAAQRDMFLDARGEVTERAQHGAQAAGVPGVVAGLADAHARFGSLPWATLIAPAIALARDGHPLDRAHAEELGVALEELRTFSEAVARDDGAATGSRDGQGVQATRALRKALEATRATFAADGGARPYREDELWRQPALADTLTRIAREGPRGFYEGALAARMADGVRAMGGLWTAEDLAKYRPIEREPIRFSYHGHQITTMPPPSSGGVVLRQILAASEATSLSALGWDTPERVHLFAEILRRAFADRNELLGDPAFVQMPLAQLLSPAYAASRMQTFDPLHATPSREVRAGVTRDEPRHTTHFSVVDGRGMAVANTFTLNTSFGALVQIPGTGVTLNNEMDDFSAKPGSPNVFGLVQGAQNGIAPGKRMLSSMSPTIVEQDGKLRAVLGSPGGPTIINTVAQVLLQLVDHGRGLQEAVRAPRVHHQWLPDELLIEPGLGASVRAGLTARGHVLVEETSIGHANCIEVDPHTGTLRAVADLTRGGGGAAAL